MHFGWELGTCVCQGEILRTLVSNQVVGSQSVSKHFVVANQVVDGLWTVVHWFPIKLLVVNSCACHSVFNRPALLCGCQ